MAVGTDLMVVVVVVVGSVGAVVAIVVDVDRTTVLILAVLGALY